MKKSKAILLAPVCLAAFLAARAASVETEADRWDLAGIYPNKQAWSEAKSSLAARLSEIEKCQGKLGENAATLRACLGTLFELRKELGRVGSYAAMLSDEDTRVDEHSQMREEASLLGSQLSQKASYVRPELLEIGEAKIRQFVERENGLKIYRQYLDDVLRQAPHTRSPEVEQVIAEAGPVTQAPSSVRRTLANADLPWPSVKLSTGEAAKLDNAGYTKYRAESNRDDRKLVFDTFWKTWKDYERTLGVSLYSNLLADRFQSQVRKYPNSLQSALAEDNIPEEVYRTLVRETNAALPSLHRYFKLRARMLGIDDLRYYDIYPSLIPAGDEFDLPQAKQLAMDAAKPLGGNYISVMKKGFADRWVDFFPRPGKRSGAYMNGSVYDVHPFMLMNFNGDFESVSTLSHEFGHAMHSYLSKNAQPYPTADYSIFVAELASTSNEALLIDHMLKNAKTGDERLFFLGNDLERIRGTYFRQAMFGEFELQTHDLVDKGEALTGSRFTEIYGDLLRRYHGHDQGVLKIDDLYAVEWAYIPHFYYDFYVYQYATSIAGGSLLASDIIEGKPGAAERYLGLLQAGSSKYPYELLKDAGVDLATSKPYRTLIARMNRVMDEIEAILEKRER